MTPRMGRSWWLSRMDSPCSTPPALFVLVVRNAAGGGGGFVFVVLDRFGGDDVAAGKPAVEVDIGPAAISEGVELLGGWM